MTTIYLYSFLSVIAVSFISLIGVFTLAIKEHVLRKYIFLLVSLAVGALLGDTFVLEKVLHWHHHALGEEKEETIHPTGRMILISDSVHNFIDGLIIAASYLLSIEV